MMEKWLERYLNKYQPDERRTKLGIFSGKIGLFSNLILFIIKLSAGLISGSVSIMGDAINSLADFATSILTLFGFHMAAKPADKKHPYGHERSEYITGLVVSLGIMFVGFQFLLNSIQRIFDPTSLNTTPLVYGLLIISVLVKLGQGFFYKQVAQKIHSNAIDAAAQDSFNDIYTTLVVLGASVVEMTFGWRIDGYAGILIALYILYNGIQIIRESIDDLLGKGPTEQEIAQIIHFLDHYTSIVGYHDLLLHHYGPNKTFATIHIEIDDSWNLTEAHRVIDAIEKDFKAHLGVDLVCHLDPIAIKSTEQTSVYQQVKRILQSYQLNLKFHDFRVEEKNGVATIQFDIVVPDNIEKTNDELLSAIRKDVTENIGAFEVEIEFDRIYLLK
ncbi:cation transporter [Desemzia sp. RIT804]|uniref:cation diffusion facilitator family transporter n=1 Tax=Desemzia sp. RIT 804 TaxID=2810209 RepID=UPI00194E2B15|nr:cation diffusion facilitator family transporter [Desemzia sp. RIT 804]MBM6615475.1 cation transporter [Desemzia sp. RIT 804]